MGIIRANSRFHRILGEAGVSFIEHATGAIRRILPHVEVSTWRQSKWAPSRCIWTSTQRTQIRITLAIGEEGKNDAGCLIAEVKRRRLGAIAGASLDTREYDICEQITNRISSVLSGSEGKTDPTSMDAIAAAFDEDVVASHVTHHHGFDLPVNALFRQLRHLSEQSYENRSLTFGCIIDTEDAGDSDSVLFPKEFVSSKKYKALSDGYRTAHHVSSDGKILEFVDLEKSKEKPVNEKHYYPKWAQPMARASRRRKCGIALSRQGDILVFDEGTLRFTYRYGEWQYWNHSHLVKLLRDKATAQRVPRNVRGRVIGALYRAALDVSFRRSGGLFLILHNRRNEKDVVRPGDVLGAAGRLEAVVEFDKILEGARIQALSRAVVVELASLDGAIVLENSGRIRAYAAILQPRKGGHLRGSEGSRTKAAIGASNYGLAVKISSDGDIVVYHAGKEFIRI